MVIFASNILVVKSLLDGVDILDVEKAFRVYGTILWMKILAHYVTKETVCIVVMYNIKSAVNAKRYLSSEKNKLCSNKDSLSVQYMMNNDEVCKLLKLQPLLLSVNSKKEFDMLFASERRSVDLDEVAEFAPSSTKRFKLCHLSSLGYQHASWNNNQSLHVEVVSSPNKEGMESSENTPNNDEEDAGMILRGLSQPSTPCGMRDVVCDNPLSQSSPISTQPDTVDNVVDVPNVDINSSITDGAKQDELVNGSIDVCSQTEQLQKHSGMQTPPKITEVKSCNTDLASEKINEMEQSNDHLKSMVQDNNQEIHNLSTKLTGLTEERDKLLTHNDELYRKSLSCIVNHQQQDKEKLTSELTTLKHKLRREESTVSQLETKNKEMRMSCSALQTQIQDERLKSQREIDRLLNLNKEMQGKLETSSSDCRNLEVENDNLKFTLEIARVETENLQNEKSGHNSSLIEKSREIQSLKERLQAASNDSGRYESEICSLKNEKMSYVKQVETMSKSYETLETKHRRLDADYKQLHKLRDKLNSDLKTTKTKLVNMMERNSTVENLNQRLSLEVDQLSMQLKQTSDAHNQLSQNYSLLQDKNQSMADSTSKECQTCSTQTLHLVPETACISSQTDKLVGTSNVQLLELRMRAEALFNLYHNNMADFVTLLNDYIGNQ